jgi:hypothetical protein
MSEESRLGREAIETAYALKQIVQAGVRVFFYLEDRERGIVKLTKRRLANPQVIAIRRDCELHKLCRGSEIMRQLDNALVRRG